VQDQIELAPFLQIVGGVRYDELQDQTPTIC